MKQLAKKNFRKVTRISGTTETYNCSNSRTERQQQEHYWSNCTQQKQIHIRANKANVLRIYIRFERLRKTDESILFQLFEMLFISWIMITHAVHYISISSSVSQTNRLRLNMQISAAFNPVPSTDRLERTWKSYLAATISIQAISEVHPSRIIEFVTNTGYRMLNVPAYADTPIQSVIERTK